MRIVLIRHGLTAGNLEKRYIGRTDEPLCAEGERALRETAPPPCDAVICSPMKRCIQSAALLYPDMEPFTEEGLRECDFGAFEGKNYRELTGDAGYQAWTDSGGTLPFPGGESPDSFRQRCTEAFADTLSRFAGARTLIYIVHGGTIMSVLDRYAVPHRDYFDWHCENAHGYVCHWDGNKLTVTERI